MKHSVIQYEGTNGAKMANEVWVDIAAALSTRVNTADKSGNMKKELKITIAEMVCILRKLLVKLKDISESKSKTISDLETAVTKMKAKHEDGIQKGKEGHSAPSMIQRVEPAASSSQGHAAPSVVNREERSQGQAATSVIIRQETAGYRAQGEAPPSDGRPKLYSVALGSKTYEQQFKITVKSKDSHSAKEIKGILKSKINPTEIKVGINSFKALADGRVLITTNRKEKAEELEKDIKKKCGEELEATLHRKRNPRLVIRNIPEEVTTRNIEETLITQNPELNLKPGDINAKFTYENKRHTRNLVVEVSAQTRKLLLQKKVKLRWMICTVEDYLVASRCFKCSRFNHHQQDGEMKSVPFAWGVTR